jgi:ferredoxin
LPVTPCSALLQHLSPPDEQLLREHLARSVAFVALACFRLLLPVLPALAALAFLNGKYIREYRLTLGKLRVHLQAVGEGPAERYLTSTLGVRQPDPDVQIRGHCVQCGNCCLNHRCAFLEPRGEGIFQCGIYTSPLRRFSNCAAFPVDAHDIARYACPSYVAVRVQHPVQAEPVRIVGAEA